MGTDFPVCHSERSEESSATKPTVKQILRCAQNDSIKTSREFEAGYRLESATLATDELKRGGRGERGVEKER
jgi:hypothetical protein